MSKANPLSYCATLVKKLDYEGYIATLFYPKEARGAAFAVRAFNLELAQAYHASKDRKVSQARLQFWLTGLETIYRPSTNSGSKDEKFPATPVCQALANYASSKRLPEYWLKRLVQARLSATEDFASLAEMEKYGEDTTGTVNYLLLSILGLKEMSADMAAKHLGAGVTIINFIRAIPKYARRSVNPPVPVSLIEKHKIPQLALLRGKTDAALRSAIFEMADAARVHFDTAADLKAKIKKPARLLYLSAEPAERYLEQLRLSHFNPFDQNLLRLEAKRNQFMPWRMWILNFKNKRLRNPGEK